MHTAPFVDLGVHHRPIDLSDRIALGFTRVLRFCADTFFAKRLKELDEGRSSNLPAPAIARHYWKLGPDATLRDLVRADEAHHRDVNHGFARQLAGIEVDPARAAPYPEHAHDIRMAA